MKPVCRVGVDLVSTGVITGPGAPTVLVNGSIASTILDTVAPHGSPPHSKAITITGASTVIAQFFPLNLMGTTIATCGHSATTGSPNVLAS